MLHELMQKTITMTVKTVVKLKLFICIFFDLTIDAIMPWNVA